MSNIGIQPIFIRFSTNINNNNAQIFTKSMLYGKFKKDDNNDNSLKNKLSEYPLFTNNVKLPINSILKLSKEQQIELFFNPLTFKKLVGNYVENDIELRNRNARDNFIILLNILFPIPFPIKSNIRETFSENIQSTVANLALDGNESMFSMISDIFGEKENEYGYLNLNSVYTITKITIINDVINDPIFSELINNSINFQNFRNEKIKELTQETDNLFNKIKSIISKSLLSIQNEFKNINTNVYQSYLRVKNKKSNINRDAKHPPYLMEPYIENIIHENINNTQNIITNFNKLYELKESSNDANYIPYIFLNIPGFNDLLNDSYNYYIQKHLLNTISDLNNANILIKKEKETPKLLSNVEKRTITVIKSYNIFDSFLQIFKKYKTPMRTYINEDLSKMINNTNTNMNDFIKFIEYINKVNKEERPDDDLLNNENMRDKLQTGIMCVSETIQTNKNENPLNKETNKYYDIMVNFELMKGVLTDKNVDDIKCEYKNEYLLELYDKLKYENERNPFLFYNYFKVFDLTKFLKETNESTPQQKGGFIKKYSISNDKKSEKKTRKKRKYFNKSIRSVYQSE